ncbi:hypothetical protein L873DRAFT_1845918 [Choiromyces venosus 120613-1]|uniref:HTH CENPB-type domain-containing protein n=1 Tax=Choiromyces venosus 120613-1 TaxID=1336337 RepID=A0A3N4JEA6_9PEZI|nr:hypothetical protein L873DRAFT_1845918 [Choiromyces venosus 120613-1]
MTIPTTPPQLNKIERKKRGPKPKRLHECHSHAAKIKPPKMQEKAWSQAQKIWVLIFLFHHQVPTTPTIHSSNNSADLLRPPTQIEVSKLFGIPQRTISECVKNKEKIEGLGNRIHTNLCTSKSKVIGKWSEMESKLYERFMEGREKGQAIRRGLFRRHSLEIFRAVYSNTDKSIFKFSNGWFEEFL